MEKNTTSLTGFSGLPLYIELAAKSGLVQRINDTLITKRRGWSDSEMLLSLILLNLAGGDCITDMNRLEQDKGLRTLLQQFSTHGLKRSQRRAYLKRWRKTKQRGLPSTAAVHRYLREFHLGSEETKRVEGQAFIPASNANLKTLSALNNTLVSATQIQCPSNIATLDQDATLSQTHKREALYCYKKYKAYQPFNTFWAEHGLILHSEFRDGNVPASYQQLRLLKESLALLPKDVEKVYLRSDSAGYQEELLKFCAEGKNKRFGVIEFAIAARVSAPFKDAVKQIKEENWEAIYKTETDGTQIKTSQEWAEVCFVPSWAAYKKQQATYRYLAIREKMSPAKSGEPIESLDLPFQTIKTNQEDYKLFGLVTNRTLPGNDVINWHRERCGKSEHVHSIQKNELAGGQFPSNLFGVNSAWWQIMILAFNLNRLMQLTALPSALKNKGMKGLRFHVIQLPGRVIYHARQLRLKVEGEAYQLFQKIRKAIAAITPSATLIDTS